MSQVSSYLTDHTHYVSLSNHCSAFAPVHSGVPHGSVLGATLFTMYIKPLSAIIDSHSIIHHSFADRSAQKPWSFYWIKVSQLRSILVFYIYIRKNIYLLKSLDLSVTRVFFYLYIYIHIEKN